MMFLVGTMGYPILGEKRFDRFPVEHNPTGYWELSPKEWINVVQAINDKDTYDRPMAVKAQLPGLYTIDPAAARVIRCVRRDKDAQLVSTHKLFPQFSMVELLALEAELDSWAGGDCLRVTLEDLRGNPGKELSAVAEFIGGEVTIQEQLIRRT